MKKIEIFDPAMCCPTGVCGPSVDPELIRITSAVHNLKNKGFDIRRYNLTSDTEIFTKNQTVNALLMEKGPDVLPITLVDGEVVKVKEYLSNHDLIMLTGITEEDLSQKPRVRIDLGK
ncbi:arsenite efflux transporter metallochaperone ArsD [Brevibacillus sp. SYSU BS000544]|uniref:arsenite efflux transporter metallochaperone ArsD n=1 Tax=Brevibacillus sp. SYSU BS000544 TaxID=3416443 RepID=UPI003CE4FE0F